MAVKVLGLVIVAIACAILVVLIPNTRIGEIMDKSINYMGVFAIPFILWFWEDKRTKEENQRREEKERLEQNKKRAEKEKQLEKTLEKYKKLLAQIVTGMSYMPTPYDFGQHIDKISFTDNEQEHVLQMAVNFKIFVKQDKNFYSLCNNTKEETTCEKLTNGAYDDQIRGYIKNNLP